MAISLTGCSELDVETRQQLQGHSELLLHSFDEENANTYSCENECTNATERSQSTFADEASLARALESREDAPPERRPISEIEANLVAWIEHSPHSLLTLSIALEEDSTWTIPSSLHDEERMSRVAARRSALQPTQDRAEVFLNARNGRILHRFWLVNHLLVEIPKERALELLTLPGMVDIQIDEEGPPPTFDGEHLKEGVRTNEYFQMGYIGNSGGPGGWDYGRIGILEQHNQNPPLTGYPAYNGLHCYHCGFYQSYCNGLRIQTASKCLSNGFCGSLYDKSACVSDQNKQHGTFVTWAAAGSIQGQQDSSYPGINTLEQRQRGGVQQGGYIYYYQADTTCRLKQAFEKLVEQGAQVVNMSFGSLECSANYDSCGLNSALSAAFQNTQTTIVAAVGNAGEEGDGLCHAGWPARRPEVLSVGALGANGSSNYRNTKRLSFSSNGTFTGTYFGGGTASINLVDLLAPGHFTKMFAGTYGYRTEYVAGTSMAAPVVAAVSNLTRDWMHNIGWTLTSGTIPALMLLFGDGYTGSLNTSNSYYSFTMSGASGTGRIRAAMINQLSSGSPRYWSTRTKTIHQGETYDWPIVSGPASSMYTGAKVAMFGVDSDFLNIPRVKLQIVDKCPTQGGTVVISTASESAGALRKKIRLSNPETQIHGRCLYARIVGLNVPSGGWKVWAATMAYSNNPDLH